MKLHTERILRVAFVLAIVTAAATAVAQTESGALNKDGVKKTITFMKQTGSSDQEIAGVISNTGVDFQMTPDDEKELRQAGASDAVVAAVRGNYRGQAAANNTPKEEPNNTPEEKPNNAPTVNNNQRAKKNKQPKQPPNIPAHTDTQLAGTQAQTPPAAGNETAAAPTLPEQPAEQPAGPTQDQKNLIFKVGDRVDVDTTQFMPPNKKWYKATVVKVNTNALGDVLDYDVMLDTVDGSEVIREHIPKRPNWIRPTSGAPTRQADQTNEQTNPATRAADNRNQDDLTFQVGDRVEVDVTQMMPPNKKWYKATVVKVNTTPLGDILDYDVKLDTLDGSEVIREHIPKRSNWIRPLK